MKTPGWALPTVALLLTATALAGCHAPADEAPPSFTYEGDSYEFRGPDELPAGWVHLELDHHGMAPHHIQLYRLSDGHSMQDLLDHLEATHAVPDWAISVGGPNPPVPGGTSSAYVHLEAGEHVMMCMIPDPDGVPHFAKGMAKSIQVVDEGNIAEPPQGTLAVSLRDFSFVADPWTAGDHVVDVQNDGEQPHEIVLVRYHEEGDFQGLLQAFAPNATGPPPADFIGGVSAIAPGDKQVFPVTLEPGRYGFICFIEDPNSGAPHFILGMEQEITVA